MLVVLLLLLMLVLLVVVLVVKLVLFMSLFFLSCSSRHPTPFVSFPHLSLSYSTNPATPPPHRQ